jgi:hypothetical protein
MSIDQLNHPALPPFPPNLIGPGKAEARMKFINHWMEEHNMEPIYGEGRLAFGRLMDLMFRLSTQERRKNNNQGLTL